MLHHKAPHRNWEPDKRNMAMFKDAVIPEPDTLWDDYATRPAALARESTDGGSRSDASRPQAGTAGRPEGPRCATIG